jgi:flagellar biosynthesis protein FlhB
MKAVRSRFVERLHATLDGAPGASPGDVLLDVVTLAAPLVLSGAVLALAVGLLQTRGAIARRNTSRARSGGSNRFRSVVDARRAGKSLLGAVVLVAVVVVTVRALERGAPDLAEAMPSARRAMDLAAVLIPALGWTVLSVLAAASVAVYLLEHGLWRSRLRMSREELAEERREHEGDPEVRRARRRVHEALLREPRRP